MQALKGKPERLESVRLAKNIARVRVGDWKPASNVPAVSPRTGASELPSADQQDHTAWLLCADGRAPTAWSAAGK